ncbi:hypothetical protein B0T42_08680, partial [Rathayibacter sp. VKM Ac-2630]
MLSTRVVPEYALRIYQAQAVGRNLMGTDQLLLSLYAWPTLSTLATVTFPFGATMLPVGVRNT